MVTMRYSNQSRWWRALCSSTLFPETSVPQTSESCEICIIPVEMDVNSDSDSDPPPPPPCGTATWMWQGAPFFWVLQSNSCTGGGTTSYPGFLGSFVGETTTTSCTCP